MDRSQLPESFYAGTSFDYEISDSVYKSSSYDLEMVLFNKSQRLTPTISANSVGSWQVVLTNTETEPMVAGAWGFQVYVYTDNFRKHLLSGVIEVIADATVDNVPAVDSRSFARQMLETVQDLMLNRSFVGTLNLPDLEALESLRWRYSNDVAKEQDKEDILAGKSNKKNFRIKFVGSK